MADLGEPIGHEQGNRRPALVVSADQLNNSRLELAIVVPLTRTRRPRISHIEIEPGVSGIPETSYAKVEDIRSVSHKRLVRRYGHVDLATLHRFDQIAKALLDLN